MNFKYMSNKNLVKEVNYIKNKNPSAKNWTATAKKELKMELSIRKKAGVIRSDAGTKKKTNTGFRSLLWR